MNSPEEIIDSLAFWEEKGTKYGSDRAAVNFDPIGEGLTPTVLERLVDETDTVCDLGCGNGLATLRLAKAKPNARFVGFDFAESMIAAADSERRRLRLDNVRFERRDAGQPQVFADQIGAFDKVLTKRLLVNLHGQAKWQAIENIHALLRPGGTYIMMECFVEPLARINDIREKIGLSPISVNPFNEYLEADFLAKLEPRFRVRDELDYESLYYFISRVFNAYLSNGAPDYNAPINQLAARLLHLGINPIRGYSPEIGFVLERT